MVATEEYKLVFCAHQELAVGLSSLLLASGKNEKQSCVESHNNCNGS